MSATPYQPVTFNGEAIPLDKLKQMTNNDQWLFENMTRVRYSVNGLVRDTGLKILAGKTPFPARSDNNYVIVNVRFGNFFTINSRPVVTCTVEGLDGTTHRAKVILKRTAASLPEVDHTGFNAVVSKDVDKTIGSGWLHWIAVSY